MRQLLLSILILALARISLTACALSMSLSGACAPAVSTVATHASPLSSSSPDSCCRTTTTRDDCSKDGAPERAPAPRPSKCCEMLAADPAKTEPLSGHASLTLALLPTGRTLHQLTPQSTSTLPDAAPPLMSPAKRRAILSVWTV